MTHTFEVIWSDDDGEFVGLCDEYPSLSYLAPSQVEAMDGIVALVAEVDKDR